MLTREREKQVCSHDFCDPLLVGTFVSSSEVELRIGMYEDYNFC